MGRKIFYISFFLIVIQISKAQIHPLKQFLSSPHMKGASFSFIAKDIDSGKIVYAFDADREMTSASVLKLVTTAVALEILGEEYRFETFWNMMALFQMEY